MVKRGYVELGVKGRTCPHEDAGKLLHLIFGGRIHKQKKVET